MATPGIRTVHPAARVADYLDRGWWTPDTWQSALGEAVRTRPGAIALVDAPNRAAVCGGPIRRLTWREVADHAAQVADALDTLGIGPGDVVGVQLPNVAETPITYLAVASLGAVVAPLPVQYREHELRALAPTVGMHALITAIGSGVRGSRPVVTGPGVPISWGKPGGPLPWTGDAPRPGPAGPWRQPASVNRLVTIGFTSGTEGAAKAIPRAHGDWVAAAWTLIDSPRLTADDTMITSFPLASASGVGTLVSWLLTGCRMVLHHPFDLEVLLRQIEAEGATFTKAPPATLIRLAQDEGLLAAHDLSSLRVIGTGSALVPEWLVRRFEQDLGIEVINSFGSSEGLCLVSDAANAPTPARRSRCFPRFGAAGIEWRVRTASQCETRLVDLDSGEEIEGPGRAGELRLRGPMVFAGYLGAERDDPRTFDEFGFYRTGDLFEIDPTDPRYYVHVDRAKDLVNRGGMKISSAEIEGLLQAHPQVAEVAAVAVPDRELGERLGVFVVPRAGAQPTLADLVAFLRDRQIASFKLPEYLWRLDRLPRNAVGKVLKARLRALADPARRD